MSFITENLEIIVSCLCVLVVLLTVTVWNLMATIDSNKLDHDEFIQWFNGTYVQLNTDDMFKDKQESQQLLVSMWEYFYTLMVARGVVPVDCKTYLADGHNDLKQRAPNLAGIMDIQNTAQQEKIFYRVLLHYQNGIGPTVKKEISEV